MKPVVASAGLLALIGFGCKSEPRYTEKQWYERLRSQGVVVVRLQDAWSYERSVYTHDPKASQLPPAFILVNRDEWVEQTQAHVGEMQEKLHKLTRENVVQRMQMIKLMASTRPSTQPATQPTSRASNTRPDVR